jgi:hypothetical protein
VKASPTSHVGHNRVVVGVRFQKVEMDWRFWDGNAASLEARVLNLGHRRWPRAREDLQNPGWLRLA